MVVLVFILELAISELLQYSMILSLLQKCPFSENTEVD